MGFDDAIKKWLMLFAVALVGGLYLLAQWWVG